MLTGPLHLAAATMRDPKMKLKIWAHRMATDPSAAAWPHPLCPVEASGLSMKERAQHLHGVTGEGLGKAEPPEPPTPTRPPMAGRSSLFSLSDARPSPPPQCLQTTAGAELNINPNQNLGRTLLFHIIKNLVAMCEWELSGLLTQRTNRRLWLSVPASSLGVALIVSGAGVLAGMGH